MPPPGDGDPRGYRHSPAPVPGVVPIPGSISRREPGEPRCLPLGAAGPPLPVPGYGWQQRGLSAGAVVTGGTAGIGAAVIPARCSPLPGLGRYPGLIPASILPQRPGHADTRSEGMARPREKLGRASVSPSGTVKGKGNKSRALEGSCPGFGGMRGSIPLLAAVSPHPPGRATVAPWQPLRGAVGPDSGPGLGGAAEIKTLRGQRLRLTQKFLGAGGVAMQGPPGAGDRRIAVTPCPGEAADAVPELPDLPSPPRSGSHRDGRAPSSGPAARTGRGARPGAPSPLCSPAMGSHEKDPSSPKRALSRSNSTVSSKHSSVQQVGLGFEFGFGFRFGFGFEFEFEFGFGGVQKHRREALGASSCFRMRGSNIPAWGRGGQQPLVLRDPHADPLSPAGLRELGGGGGAPRPGQPRAAAAEARGVPAQEEEMAPEGLAQGNRHSWHQEL